jgi:light-regulated signal transduction histidine kinase (bacteriophytochrome)
MSTLGKVFEDQELLELVVLADAVSGLMHDLNNCLNRVALQASVVQLQGGEALREETAVIRRETAAAASLLRPLTMARQRHRQIQTPTDLNRVVEEVIQTLSELRHRVVFERVAKLVVLPSDPTALRRLLGYLFRLALTDPEHPTRITVRTKRAGPEVSLILEMKAKGDDGSPADWFEPEADLASPESLLERLAFQSLLRLLNATFASLPEPQCGVVLTWTV